MPGLFISYRRQDSAGHTGRLFDRLQARLGRDRIFMDVTGIDAGVDFIHTIERAVSSCDVLMAVIGPEWLTTTDANGHRRLDDPGDFVRLEISTALQRNVRVIPVLVAGASLPPAQALPDDLKPLARRQTMELRDSRWDSDAAELVAALERQIGSQPAAPVSSSRKLALALAGLVVAVVIVIPLARSRARLENPASPAAATTVSADPELMLDYRITTRPNPKKHPDSSPIQVVGGAAVSAGDFVRFSFHSPHEGFLYVLNESPSDANRRTSFNVLFPTPTTNKGSPQLVAGQTLFIPERGDGFELDDEPGSERLWLVWSVNAINELDAVTHWANQRDQGEIKSPQDIDLARNFLTLHASPAPQAQEVDGKGTTLKARGQMFVKLITLEHRR